MKLIVGIGFSLYVLVAAIYAFSPRALPAFPKTAVVPESLLLLGAARAGTRLVTGGEHGYLFTSDDDGATWRQAGTPVNSTLTALYFHDAKHGWAVGHDSIILRTDDGGATWRRTHFAPDEQKPLLDVWFQNELEGYAIGAYGSAYRSSDGGKTWQTKPITDSDQHLNALAKAGDGTLFIAGEAGTLLRSRDAGATWESLATPYRGSFFGVLGLKDGGVLTYGLRGKIFRSSDDGQSWSPIETGSEISLMGGKVFEDGRVALVGHDGAILISHDDARSFVLQKRADRKATATVLRAPSAALLLFGEAGVTRLKPLPH